MRAYQRPHGHWLRGSPFIRGNNGFSMYSPNFQNALLSSEEHWNSIKLLSAMGGCETGREIQTWCGHAQEARGLTLEGG